MKPSLLPAAFLTGVVLVMATLRAGADGVPAALLACATEQDDARRLACYDAEVARLRQAPSGGPVAPAAVATMPPASSAANPLSEEEKFGLRGDLKQEMMPELHELEALVTKVATKPQGELVLTLENDQVWSEIAPYSGIRVKVGDRVTIKRGALRSFNLVAPNGRSSKVTRIR